MKQYLFLLVFFGVICSGFAQYKPAVVGLKSGDSISGILGDIQNKVFKYKTQVDGKSKKVEFSEIDYVRILYSGKEVKTFRFFQLNYNEKYTQVEQLATGKNAELYGATHYIHSPGFATPSMGQQEIVKYYIRKPLEDKLTFLGIYNPINNSLKMKTIGYFSDCPELLEKILSKVFNVRKDMKAIVEFYNSECQSL